MYSILTTLIDRLPEAISQETEVIEWGAPVPSFGDVSRAVIATLGLNPSNREFVDECGNELRGTERRFHSLDSLGISRWDEADASHLCRVVESCDGYFCNNPYDRWFRTLDTLLSASGVSYYPQLAKSVACHLDLIPYATRKKWTNLGPGQRERLLMLSGGTLGLLLRDSPVQLLVLNGRSVVAEFERTTRVSFARAEMPDWLLPRSSGEGVKGVAYLGEVDVIGGVELERRIKVLGYNHNLQSSFGVTKKVIKAIGQWIAAGVTEVQR